jgi:hypothetical protein
MSLGRIFILGQTFSSAFSQRDVLKMDVVCGRAELKRDPRVVIIGGCDKAET